MSFFSKFFGAGRYTRAASRDFRPEDLPDTGIKLFFDALGIRWSAMVGQNLLYLLFWLPAVIWSGVNLLTLVPVSYTHLSLSAWMNVPPTSGRRLLIYSGISLWGAMG